MMTTAKTLKDSLVNAMNTAASLDDDELEVMQAALSAEQRRRTEPPRKASGTFAAARGDTVEDRAEEVFRKEGFRIEVVGAEPRERGFPPYAFERRMRSDATVQQWKNLRFARYFPGRDAKVFMGDGTEARGSVHLETVVQSYKTS
jgi:hypothetical protein